MYRPEFGNALMASLALPLNGGEGGRSGLVRV